MQTTTEKLLEKSKKLFLELYHQGMSINDIKNLSNNLIKIGEDVIKNPKNTIGAISNGKIIIE